MSEQVQEENKMGVMPVGKLLLGMALPMVLSMLVQALYNVVDSYFVAKISQDALNAVSLAFPVQNIIIGIATGTGVGINALLSRSLGEKNYEVANESAGNGIMLAILSGLVMLVVGLTLPRFFFQVQTDIPGIVEQGTVYLTICCTLSIGVFLEIIFERLLQSTGMTVLTMATQGVGAIINIIMDPILIFGIGPFPEMGVAGAAVATVVGQILGAVLGLVLNLGWNKELTFAPRYLRLKGNIVKKIYAVGVPSVVMNTVGSAMVFGLNQILMGFTDTATAVFGVYYKLQSFIFMPVFGLNNGMVPIIAYNYGAKKKKRIMDTMKLSVIAAVAIMLVGLVVAETMPAQLLGIFNASEEMLTIGVPALRTICTCFIFAGFGIVASSVFQALGHGIMSMVISIVRQLVVLLPAAYLLSLTGRLELVWFAFPIAELFSMALCVFFTGHIIRKVINPIEE